MKGLSTKISKKKAFAKKQPQWFLLMTIGEGSTLVPTVTLCTKNTSAEMMVVATDPTDMVITFQVRGFSHLCAKVGFTTKLHYLSYIEEAKNFVCEPKAYF